MPGQPRAQNVRVLLSGALALLLLVLLYLARRALLPFVLGSALAYLVAPLVDWVSARLPTQVRGRRSWRGLVVLAVYLLLAALLAGSLALMIPPIGAQVSVLAQRLPELAGKLYAAAPEIIRGWVNWYNQAMPTDVRAALQRLIAGWISSLLTLLQQGTFKTVEAAFRTLSFVLGLVVVPLWMFYILRDQPEIGAAFDRLLPPTYRDDVRNALALMDSVLGAYLRGQFLLCLSVGLMFTVGLLFLGIDFALLLGVVCGVFEIVPVLGPVLGAIPAVLVALATSPTQVLWVVVLALAVQQLENIFLVPQIQGMTVRLHPALVMLALVIGSELGGVVGVILSVPLTAVVRDLASYLYQRLSQPPASPADALTHFRPRS